MKARLRQYIVSCSHDLCGHLNVFMGVVGLRGLLHKAPCARCRRPLEV